MEKISNSEDDDDIALHNVESFVLDRLLIKHNSEKNSSISVRELMKSIDTKLSPLLDQAIEDLIAQSLISSSDGENYMITKEGIVEFENRKRETIPL